MPILGVIFYFDKTRRFIPDQLAHAKLISIGILTIILPILLFFLLKTLNKVHSIYLRDVKERILPLTMNCIIVFLKKHMKHSTRNTRNCRNKKRSNWMKNPRQMVNQLLCHASTPVKPKQLSLMFLTKIVTHLNLSAALLIPRCSIII